jgi:LuxR family maltose regulon positive regulatory protein
MICFDDLGGAQAAAREALASLPGGSPVRSAVQALSAWHAHLLGDAEHAQLLARDALAGQVHLPSAGLPLVAYLPVAVLALGACERGDLDAATGFVAEAVAARDSGPLRGAPHSLPVTCASARLLTLRGDREQAVTLCLAGLELARDWRDSSLMVPALLLELARAHAALGHAEDAAAAARAGGARIAGACDAGGLASALQAFDRDPSRSRPGAVSGRRGGVPGGASGRRVGGAGGSREAFGRHASGAHNGAEELSGREVEVLRALAGAGSLREVADALFISRNTIKTHTRALYAKLGVGTREEAVRRGRELGLLGGTLTRSSREESPT